MDSSEKKMYTYLRKSYSVLLNVEIDKGYPLPHLIVGRDTQGVRLWLGINGFGCTRYRILSWLMIDEPPNIISRVSHRVTTGLELDEWFVIVVDHVDDTW